MNRPLARRLLAVVLFAALPLGCAKKVTNVDPAYTQIEGVPNGDSRLVVWPDTPNSSEIFDDLPPVGPSPDDTLLSTETIYATSAGSVHIQLLDGTTASSYQMFRRESNGGYRQLRDYVLTSPRRWLDSQWELYTLTDPAPSGFSPPTYLGRGVVSGSATPNSPLSNAAEVSQPVAGTLAFTAPAVQFDSLFTISWTEDLAASGYWVHVYQLRSDITQDELLRSGNPSPIVNGRVRDIFVGYFPAGTTSYRIGNPAPLVLTRRGTLLGQVYLVRVSAVGADGELINYMPGSLGIIQAGDTYRVFPLAAFALETRRRTGPEPSRSASVGVDGAFGVPGFGILPAR